jgi:hypothetical protein
MEEKDMEGGCGTTMLGERTEETINHEFSLLEELLSHYAHVSLNRQVRRPYVQ